MKNLLVLSIFSIIFLFAKKASANDSTCVSIINGAKKLCQENKYKAAIILIDSSMNLCDNKIELYNLRACVSIHSSYVNDEVTAKYAIADFTKAIALNDKNFMLYSNRGSAYSNIDDFTNALKDYKMALNLDSSKVENYGNVLRMLWVKNRFKEAYAFSEKIIAKFPNNGYAYHVRGNLKRDYLHKYPEGNIDIKKSEILFWKQGMLLYE